MPFISTPHEIVGELDAFWSPTIEVEFLINGVSRQLRCFLDTGSHEEVVITDYAFAANTLGLTFRIGPSAPRVERYVADGRKVKFVVARATVVWFHQRPIVILAPDPTEPAVFLDLAPDEEAPDPRILIGVPLLLGTRVELDYVSRPGGVRLVAPRASWSAPQT